MCTTNRKLRCTFNTILCFFSVVFHNIGLIRNAASDRLYNLVFYCKIGERHPIFLWISCTVNRELKSAFNLILCFFWITLHSTGLDFIFITQFFKEKKNIGYRSYLQCTVDIRHFQKQTERKKNENIKTYPSILCIVKIAHISEQGETKQRNG